MINVSQGWNENQKSLKIFLSNHQTFNNGISLLLEMHSLLHDKKVYKKDINTFFNYLLENLKEETCTIISKKETSIYWNIWHITRIEDIVSNILIGNSETVFDKETQTKINIEISDTGNAMTYPEIELLNGSINFKHLKEYRNRVGRKTMEIVKKIEYIDLKRKVERNQLNRIIENGGVTKDPKSNWLLDFWGKKNIFRLIMMPITRHQIIHLNDCFSIKEKCN